jgi:abortive infection bacteriophage resistance protein
MSSKPALSVDEQIELLKERGLGIEDIDLARHYLQNVSYYRLKGYWWDMQADLSAHIFHPGYTFTDVVDRYNFDRHLRLILFDAIERIEIAVRTRLIYYMSCAYGPCWYLDHRLFDGKARSNGIPVHQLSVDKLLSEFKNSSEIFAVDHRKRYPQSHPDSWKVLEVASLGNLSKLYKNIQHTLPAKGEIAKSMGLNIPKELSSWLECIAYVRNIVAHHSRLWSRKMVKRPVLQLNNPMDPWLNVSEVSADQQERPYLIISCMLFLCNRVTPGHHIKLKLLELFNANPPVFREKVGFIGPWQEAPIWRV